MSGSQGFGTPRVLSATDTPAVFLLDNIYHTTDITLVSTAVDAGSSPTTQLRAGLALGKITASGKYVDYDDDGTDDGRRTMKGLLLFPVNMKEPDGTARDQVGVMVVAGHVSETLCYGVDAAGKVEVGDKFIWSGDYH